MRNLHKIQANTYSDLLAAQIWHLQTMGYRTAIRNDDAYYFSIMQEKWRNYTNQIDPNEKIEYWKRRGSPQPDWNKIEYM